MRVADYVIEILAEAGMTQAFLVTGGGAMHLNDAIGRETRITKTFCHHEQACSMAAESYARLSGRPALVNVTSGPGSINALNGVFGAYVDSIPMVVLSGQVKRETLVSSYDVPLRQLGDQEVDIVAIAATISKFVFQLSNPDETRYYVEKALWIAENGRPGPVWLDIPIDIQSSQVNLQSQRKFDPKTEGEASLPAHESNLLKGEELKLRIEQLLSRLREAKRPVILVGTGVRTSGSHAQFIDVVEKLGIPVATAFNAHDALWNEHDLYAGRPGSVGDRAGNFTVQNSDFLLVLGCRLSIRQIGYSFKSFARAAFVSMVDIDEAELGKPTLSIDLPIHADLRDVLSGILASKYVRMPSHREYLEWCKVRVSKYPVVIDEYRILDKPLNPYVFVEKLFELLGQKDVVVAGDGTASVATFQAAYIKPNQRMYTNAGSATMGYELPAAIGAALVEGTNRVICLAGDGSIMMNLQELQTIKTNNLQVKIFIFNNNGYSSIRQTQQNYFPDNIVGCDPESGVGFPDFVQIGGAFGIASHRCESSIELQSAIEKTLKASGPQLLELVMDREQRFAPKLSSRQLPDGSMVSASLEDMSPFLSREELAANMLIDLEE